MTSKEQISAAMRALGSRKKTMTPKALKQRRAAAKKSAEKTRGKKRKEKETK